MIEFTVVDCRADPAPPVPGAAGQEHVGPRPGKSIDGLLTGRIVVLGDDADLAAVAVRLLRRDLIATVEVVFAPSASTAVTRLWSLPVGPEALGGAESRPAVGVTLVRDDVGGVLVGSAVLEPVHGTVYVDEHRVLGGVAARMTVRPDPAKGLLVTVTGPRRLGVLPGRSVTMPGRAVQIGTLADAPATVISDGVSYPRPMDRWTFYKHTEPLLLVGATVPEAARPAERAV